MARPKKDTPEGRLASERWYETMRERYGDNWRDKQASSGAKGGSVKGTKGGFAANPELARKMGLRIGKISRKGYKYLRTHEGFHHYIKLDTGESVKYPK